MLKIYSNSFANHKLLRHKRYVVAKARSQQANKYRNRPYPHFILLSGLMRSNIITKAFDCTDIHFLIVTIFFYYLTSMLTWLTYFKVAKIETSSLLMAN